jgi:hypothetical protein
LLLALSVLAATLRVIVYMGWLGAADIVHRDLNIGRFLLSAVVLAYLSFRPVKPAGL